MEIGLAVATAQAMEGAGGPPITRIGLIDTGARRTAISNPVLEALRPNATGMALYRRADQSANAAPLHAIRLKFGGHLAPNPWFDLEVIAANPATPGVDVLVGMDVHSQLALFYEGVNGHMILTY